MTFRKLSVLIARKIVYVHTYVSSDRSDNPSSIYKGQISSQIPHTQEKRGEEKREER